MLKFVFQLKLHNTDASTIFKIHIGWQNWTLQKHKNAESHRMYKNKI